MKRPPDPRLCKPVIQMIMDPAQSSAIVVMAFTAPDGSFSHAESAPFPHDCATAGMDHAPALPVSGYSLLGIGTRLGAAIRNSGYLETPDGFLDGLETALKFPGREMRI